MEVREKMTNKAQMKNKALKNQRKIKIQNQRVKANQKEKIKKKTLLLKSQNANNNDFYTKHETLKLKLIKISKYEWTKIY